MKDKAVIIFKNHSCYRGYFFGHKKPASGELVFNTGMVGYPEAITDPSYKGQVLVLTYPLVGNYGAPDKKYWESDKIQVSGLIVDNYSVNHSHFAAKKSLDQWLKEQKIPGVFGVDTRTLAKELRTSGTTLAKIVPGQSLISKKSFGDFFDPNETDLVGQVSVKKTEFYPKGRKTMLLIDCGLKLSILSALLDRDISVIRTPYDYDLSKIKNNFDGVIISNGPGDPKACKTTIHSIKQLLKAGMPVLGICLGNQLLALAEGGDTYKLKFGHRGQNQPCCDTRSKKCYITSQNHGYAVQPKSLPSDWAVWFYNNNDQTVEGIRHKTKPFMAVQFHPEANPGPTDTKFIFDDFIKML